MTIMTTLKSLAPTGTRIAPGVYFGLPEFAYHDDPALGSGDIRRLHTCPMYYWRESAMNPMRARDADTPALIFGRALHKLVLEGRAAFEAAYTSAPVPADHPGCLITVDDIKDALRALGEKLTGNKPELVARLKAANPAAVIFDDILNRHAAEAARTGATILPRAVYEQVIVAGGFVAADPYVAPAFQGGRAEISVFWDDAGVPRKARLDYIRLGRNKDRRLVALSTDLKSFANQRDLPPERAVAAAIAEYRLDMQAAHNLDGAAQIAGFIKSGKVTGADGISPKWLEALTTLEPADWLWHWAFFQKDAPVCLLRPAGATLISHGRAAVASALNSYRENMQAFGTAWRYVDPMPENALDLGDLPAWFSNAA